MRTYTELIKFSTFDDRFRYLMLHGDVGASTFGFDRYLNQRFYASPEWKQVRNFVIARDGGCDLGIADREITGKVMVHHMNPIIVSDMKPDLLLNPDFLICVSMDTHNAIHYGDESILHREYYANRFEDDTMLWKKGGQKNV